MTSTAEVIVLSSSPVPQSKTPSRPPGNPDKLRSISPPATTPPPVISTSDPVQLPSRSRFFANKPVTDKGAKKKKTTTKKSTAQDPDGKDASSKPRKRGKKEAKEPEPTALENIGLESLDSSHDTKKKTAGSEKNRKRKTSKSKETGNMTLAGKVTKASGDSQAKKSKTGKKGASAPAEETEEKESNVLEKDEELHLQGAMRRRLDWTPPRETVPADATTTESDGHYAKQPNSPSMGGFGKLLSDFNYAGSASESRTIPLNTDGAGPTKRRRIELVDANLQPQPNKSDSNDESSAQGEGSSACAKPKKKSKAPKRLTTLTARMTAQYARDDESDDVTNELTQQFGKPKSRRGKTKTAETDTVFTVLSPEAAANSLNDQDLVFGTCSQLEREDSPQTLREMQQAITASESIPEERTQSSIFGSQKTKAAELSSARSVSRLTGTRNLWSVAARDTEGSLARAKDLDVCDLTGASEVSQKQDDNASRSKSLLDDDWFELDYGKPGPSKKTTSLSEKIANPTINKQPPARPEEASCTKDVQVEPTSTAQVPPQQPSMPQYSGFTDAELSRQVVSYGFKSVRGRKKMIELLQKCWESKHGSSDKPLGSQSQSQPENARSDATIQSQAHDVPAQAAAPSRKPKPKVQANHSQKTGTTTEEATVSPTMPKKSAQKAKILEPLPSVSSFIDVEEIQDSQDEITPPSSQPGQKPSKEVHVPPSSFIDIEEIQDSEDEVTPSPSRVQKRYTEIFSNASSSIREPSLDIFTKPMSPSPKKSKPAAHKSSHAGKTTAPASPTKSKQQSSKRSSLPGISTQITKAVRGQSHASANPSMGGRSHPTWHEKMLMYDPIILEDFTTWLNVEGLGLVGEDREVNTTDVREWCESKGICCCWKNSATW